MSVKVFQDDTFPRHVSDLINLMHMMIFEGTDGDEEWETYLSLKQKEYISLAIAQYYQCEHCIEHHLDMLCNLEKTSKTSLSKNVSSMILFLRIETKLISEVEKIHWVKSWKRFSFMISKESQDPVLPYLIGLSIGIARDDEFLIEFCGKEVCKVFSSNNIDSRVAIGELESVVIFMKAATSKNRVVDKIERLLK